MSEAQLRRWCRLANRAGRNVCGYRNSCIATSHALAAFLRSRGIDAEPFRAEAYIHSPDRSVYGSVLGSRGDGSRQPAASPGSWRGHLAVACGAHVLDPTIDQAPVGGKRIRPAVFAMPDQWDDGHPFRWSEQGLSVTYSKYYRQVGWKSAPDSRPSHWRVVAREMEYLHGVGWH